MIAAWQKDRIFPAIDIRRSGTRKEEMLIEKDHLDKLWAMRKSMDDSQDFVEYFFKRIKKTKSNQEFFDLFEKEKSGSR